MPGKTRISIALFAAFCIGAGASAQEATETLTPEQIVERWMSSAHADATAEAFVHWNEDGEIPGTCAVCHSTPGFVAFLGTDRMTAGAIDHAVPTGTTVECTVCHNPGVPELSSVVFPSGEMASVGDGGVVCSVCHQGRASTDSVNRAVAELDADVPSPDLGFINVHYAAAAATLMGGAVRGGYQYDGLTYAGQFSHVPQLATCTDCHDPHTLEVSLETCTACHAGAAEFEAIRTGTTDFDGDGDVTEGMGQVIADIHQRLGTAIGVYATDVVGAPVAYSDAAYPYFFADTDGDGAAGPDKSVFPNRYQSWTPRMLRAAYNYQYVAKDGGAHAHNPHYVLQLMIDSLHDLSQVAEIDTGGLTRP